jgi:Ca-activated chloride channel family protein
MDRLAEGNVTVAAPWFTNPWAFWLLGLLPFLALVGLLSLRRRRRALARLGTLSALLTLAARRTGLRFLRGLCLFAGLGLIILGVAGPQWGRDWEEAVASGRDLVVVLDLSRSMLAQDVLPSRIERARRALRDLSYTVQRHGGQRLALIVFAARAQVVCPLTHDYDHFRLAVAQQDPANAPRDLRPRPGGPTSGTRIGTGLEAAVKALGTGSGAAATILLLSDGDDPGRDDEWQQGARAAKKRQVPVFAIGIGKPRPVKGEPVFIPFAGDYIRDADGRRV